MVLDMRQQFSGKLDRAKARVCHSVFSIHSTNLVIQKTHVERRVVGNEYRIAQKVEQRIGDIGKHGSVLYHLVVNSRERSNEWRDRRFGIYKRVKLFGNCAAADPERADLGDPAWRSFGAGGFKIENDEIRFQQPARFHRVLHQFDRVLNELKSGITIAKILNKQSRNGRIGLSNVHYVIDDL